MVQVVPNRTQIEAKVLSRSPHPSLKDFDLLEVELEKGEPVEGYADLLSQRVGSRTEIAVKKDLLGDAPVEGARLHGRAYLGGPGEVFVEPDPEPGSFRIERA